MYRNHPVNCPNPKCQQLNSSIRELELHHKTLKNLKTIFVVDIITKTYALIMVLSLLCWILALLGSWLSYQTGICGSWVLAISSGAGIKFLIQTSESVGYYKQRTELLKNRLFLLQRKRIEKWEPED